VPSETVYGLAANALDAKACRAIFRAKGRPSTDPLIVHIHSLTQLYLVAHVSAAAIELARAFWPGPLTLVLPKRPIVPDLVTAGLPSVAVRMPSHKVFLELLRESDLPLAAPSANPFGYVSPTTAQHVLDGLGKKISYVLDGGEAEIGLESTILDLRNSARPRILRPGAIDAEAIAGVLRRPVKAPRKTKGPKAGEGAVAPGMLSKHYSPKTPIKLVRQLSEKQVTKAAKNEFVLFLSRPKGSRSTDTPSAKNVGWLTPNGDLRVAAKGLFATLRRLDGERWKRIFAELAPGDSALALAINDRLTRAAAKR
jgi:L-threonylcarbamoyladenylate synthase